MKDQNIRRILTLALIVVTATVFTVISDSFLSYRNICMLLKDSAYVGLIALGASYVIVNGGVDLSGTGIICFVSVIAARVANISGMPGILAIIAGCAVGAVCGLFNALIVLKLKLSDFVTTLATASIFSGLALMTTFREGGRIVSVALTNKSFLIFGQSVGGIYYITIMWIALTIIMQFILKKTKFGLYTVAMGSNQKSAGMSGINCFRLKVINFMIGGAFAGLAAAMVVAYQTGTSMKMGTGMAFQAVAACVVGGMVLGGGKGDPVASFLGSLLITMVTNGLRKLGLSTAGVDVFYGIVIVLAMLLDSLLSSMSQKRLSSIEQL